LKITLVSPSESLPRMWDLTVCSGRQHKSAGENVMDIT